MKLRNKKTGEIGELTYFADKVYVLVNNELNTNLNYTSLAELNEEWEDYEEKGWYITENGEVRENRSLGIVEEESEYREIGNYFETKEEAEKAVEKLKAWKRLKDKGVEFYGWRKNQTGTYDFLARWKGAPPKMSEIINDLDLLLGDEQ